MQPLELHGTLRPSRPRLPVRAEDTPPPGRPARAVRSVHVRPRSPRPTASRAFLAAPGRFATLATLDADGAPRQAVVWYRLDAGRADHDQQRRRPALAGQPAPRSALLAGRRRAGATATPSSPLVGPRRRDRSTTRRSPRPTSPTSPGATTRTTRPRPSEPSPASGPSTGSRSGSRSSPSTITGRTDVVTRRPRVQRHRRSDPGPDRPGRDAGTTARRPRPRSTPVGLARRRLDPDRRGSPKAAARSSCSSGGVGVPEVRFGAQLWSQATDWPGFLAAAVAAEEAGWDAVWTWDHLHAIFGPWEQPILEGWLAMGAVAARTSRVRVGLMVGANTFRNPGPHGEARGHPRPRVGRTRRPRHRRGLVRPRARGVRDRLRGRASASGSTGSTRPSSLMRRLLDGERFSHAGRFYRFDDALLQPAPGPGAPADPRRRGRAEEDAAHGRPLGRRLEHERHARGGGGPRRDPARALRGGRARPGDDRADGQLPDRPARRRRPTPQRAFRALCAAQRDARRRERARRSSARRSWSPPRSAPTSTSASRTIVVRLPAPHDPETIARIGEVRAALAG